MFQNYDISKSESKVIRSDNVDILPSMKGISQVSFDSYVRGGASLDGGLPDVASSGCCSSMNVKKNEPLEKYAKSGYVISHFVKSFIDTDAGQIPVVSTQLNFRDRLETVWARTGITRNSYRVTPGLYSVGKPDENSEILVTANFKLTFDILRTSLNKINTTIEDISAWILVLDTLGVNVWCAAGKGTFSTEELVRRVKSSGVENIVKHRRLILPQLSATGIRAKDVKKMCGFSVIYGPVRAADIPSFLQNSRKAGHDMRRVTFTFSERVILTPVELSIALKPALITAAILIIISGIGPEFFSVRHARERGWISIVFLLTGLMSGAVVTPALLPFLPFKEFAAKGIISGAAFALCALFFSSASSLSLSAMLALFLFGTVVSSWMAMNFTGATPFTSPSGVEKEMKRFIPVQAGSLILSLALWIYSGVSRYCLLIDFFLVTIWDCAVYS